MKAATFWRDESGQDPTEHGLLFALVCLMSVAILYSGHDSVIGIWTAANNLVGTVAKHVVNH